MNICVAKTKGADQLCGYRAADMYLCFPVCKKQIFSQCGSYLNSPFIEIEVV